ncbi:PQQ-binding-like beta-propeller repeat protein [Candidatus Pelagibacter communis]|uniref:PQQ-binding-like beta-propeller repeat protein n=1 Tax=Candidatus Pelagibacter TaxID=198251 RepID=UPI003EDFAABB
MNKILIFLICIFFTASCSFNKNSKFWTASQNIPEENNPNYQEIFVEEEALNKELNANVPINLGNFFNKDPKVRDYFNNDGRLNFDGVLKKSSRYKFSKIKNFYQFEPKISFNNKDLIFFDNKGSILKFDDKSKLIWKKNYYSKSEKKLKPILQFANDGKTLVVADNIAKYFALDINTGELLWSKNNLAPFNSQIKIFKDKFFIIDFSNTLRCFSLRNGEELWNIRTENSLIRSQKKLSMVIVNDLIYFKNSIGDISAVDINEGELLWQLPTQSSLIYEAAFSLETSDLITDGNTLFFSNNKNQFFSIDLGTGSFNWENQVNSSLRPSLVGNYIFTVSLEGYLIVIEKNSGNIIRVTDVFNNFKKKKRDKIKPVGFIIGTNNIYLSTDNGRLMVIDIKSGRTKSILKIDNDKISRPHVIDKDLYVVKENAIIRLN